MRPFAAPDHAVELVRPDTLTPVPDTGAVSQPREQGGWLTAHRMVSLTAVLALLWPEFMAWNDVISAPIPGLTTIALTGATLVLACLIAAAPAEEALERLDRWLLVLGLLVLVALVGYGLRNSSGYSTDEAAFVHGAATALLHGHDPYGINLLGSLSRFGVPEIYWTYTMNGGVVSTLGYPALPVLVAAPFAALFPDGQAVLFSEVIALLLAVGVTFVALPRRWRSLAVLLCVGFPILEGFAVVGLNVVLMLPALIIVARRWPRVGESGRLVRHDWLAAVALGLALSTNQLVWFIAPFILVAILLMRTDRVGARRAFRITAAYGGIAAATFLVLNAPFIAWGPSVWWRGVAAPLSQHAIPYGQGLIGLTAMLGLGGGSVDAYTYASAALYVALLVLFAIHFRTLARACFILPVIALYAGGRSLSEYWLVLIAPTVIGALAADGAPLRAAAELRWPSRARLRVPAKIAAPAMFAPAAALLALALLTPAPLALQVLGVQANHQDTAVIGLTVAVQNRTDTPLRPHFAINSTGQASPFWRIVKGPRVLGAGSAADYVLGVTDVDPAHAGPFRLQAVTDTPRTVSSSSVVRPRLTFTQG